MLVGGLELEMTKLGQIAGHEVSVELDSKRYGTLRLVGSGGDGLPSNLWALGPKRTLFRLTLSQALVKATKWAIERNIRSKRAAGHAAEAQRYVAAVCETLKELGGQDAF